LKLPTTYTVLPTISWSHTIPSTCTVGRESAVTVLTVSGGSGALSAAAGARPGSRPIARRVAASIAGIRVVVVVLRI
jgi:hypothetical protein